MLMLLQNIIFFYYYKLHIAISVEANEIVSREVFQLKEYCYAQIFQQYIMYYSIR